MADWKEQLKQIQKDMEKQMTPEEKKKMYQEKEQERKRREEFERNKPFLYEFLAGYKQNSGIYINNFLRNRTYKMYCEDKFHDFAFDISGIIPNIFDNPTLSISIVDYLNQLEKNHIAYFPIAPSFMQRLIGLSKSFDSSKKTDSVVTLYRGCSTLERNGVNGIVSTTLDKNIAEQFSRGTVLTINLPAGSSYIDVKNIRPKEQRAKDKEIEWILPPCDYEVVSETRKPKHLELNNFNHDTLHITLNVKERDFLTDLYARMCDMPEEYKEMVYPIQADHYEEAKLMLEEYMAKRKKMRRN